jgi:ribonuclease HI
MHSPFEAQLQEAATLLIAALAEAGIDAKLDPRSWQEYAVKISAHAKDQSIGLINLYFSPKRSGFTMRTHQINNPTYIPSIERIWTDLESSGDLKAAAALQASVSRNQGSLFTPPMIAPPSPSTRTTTALTTSAAITSAATPDAPTNPAPTKATDATDAAPTKAKTAHKKREDVDVSGLSVVHIYVDGSYIAGKIGYGWAALDAQGNHLFDEFGAITDPDLRQQRQVSGELIATQRALLWCIEQGLTHAEIYYDYEGVAKWVTGAWQAKQSLTQTYRDFMRACPVKLRWHKVQSHTGVRWNEYVDQLAKKGAYNGRPTPLATLADLSAHKQHP